MVCSVCAVWCVYVFVMIVVCVHAIIDQIMGRWIGLRGDTEVTGSNSWTGDREHRIHELSNFPGRGLTSHIATRGAYMYAQAVFLHNLCHTPCSGGHRAMCRTWGWAAWSSICAEHTHNHRCDIGRHLYTASCTSIRLHLYTYHISSRLSMDNPLS